MKNLKPFNINTKDGIKPSLGIPYILKVGDKRIKFMLQYDIYRDDNKHALKEYTKDKYYVVALTHYASGRIVLSYNNLASQRILNFKSYQKEMPWRLAAELALSALIEKNGIDRVLNVINSAPVIN